MKLAFVALLRFAWIDLFWLIKEHYIKLSTCNDNNNMFMRLRNGYATHRCGFAHACGRVMTHLCGYAFVCGAAMRVNAEVMLIYFSSSCCVWRIIIGQIYYSFVIYCYISARTTHSTSVFSPQLARPKVSFEYI